MKHYIIVVESIGTFRYFGPMTKAEYELNKHKYPKVCFNVHDFDTLAEANQYLGRLNIK